MAIRRLLRQNQPLKYHVSLISLYIFVFFLYPAYDRMGHIFCFCLFIRLFVRWFVASLEFVIATPSRSLAEHYYMTQWKRLKK